MSEKKKTRLAPNVSGILHLGNLRTFIYNWFWAVKNEAKIELRLDNIIVEKGITKPPQDEERKTKIILYTLERIGIPIEDIYKLSDFVIEACSIDFIKNNPLIADAIVPVWVENDEFDTYYKSSLAILYYGLFADKKRGITDIFRCIDDKKREISERLLMDMAVDIKHDRIIHYCPSFLNKRGELMHKRLWNSPILETLESHGMDVLQAINYLFFSGMNLERKKMKYEIQELIELFDESKIKKEETICEY